MAISSASPTRAGRPRDLFAGLAEVKFYESQVSFSPRFCSETNSRLYLNPSVVNGIVEASLTVKAE